MSVESATKELIERLGGMDLDARVSALNEVRRRLSEVSPFSAEPVDCVEWVPADSVHANDYNPNAVAPPEMELLRLSISADGYTQPIVTYPQDDKFEVVDGFHRHRVGKECEEVRERVREYLPVVRIKTDRELREDRIAATIRHNRARGKHQIEAMSDIVIELKRRNWSESRIAKELGMDADEVLRLCQITGLAEAFADAEFSEAWDIGIFRDDSFEELTDEDVQRELNGGRIYHTWDKWECYPAGFYEEKPPEGMTEEACEIAYRDLLATEDEFRAALARVIDEWPSSCEHYLTNERMNRIAWLGQASLTITRGIPHRFRGGYNLLTPEQQEAADLMALDALNTWRKRRDEVPLSLEEAQSKTQPNLY